MSEGTDIANDTDGTAQTVLIVDDSTDTRHVLAQIIQPLGVNVIEAVNGRQALGILKKQRIDVVLSDLVMPRMSGLMLLHSMLEQGHQMPFILVTGFSDMDSAIQALRLGAFDYFEKPVHDTDLVPTMREALKVSYGQRQILAALQRPAGTPANVGPDAELQIMKMRALRHRQNTTEFSAQDFPTARGQKGSWQELRDLFVQEAAPQLIFAEGALKELFKSEALSQELSYVLRVIQTLRMAAESIRLSDLAEFAWSLEAAIAALKSNLSEIGPNDARLLIEATGLLKQKVADLDRSDVRDLQGRLDAVAERFREGVPSTKNSA